MNDQLGRINITTKVSLLSSYGALTIVRHLDVAVYVIAHEGKRYHFRFVYNFSYPEIDHSIFKECEEFYRDAKEGRHLHVCR